MASIEYQVQIDAAARTGMRTLPLEDAGLAEHPDLLVAEDRLPDGRPLLLLVGLTSGEVLAALRDRAWLEQSIPLSQPQAAEPRPAETDDGLLRTWSESLAQAVQAESDAAAGPITSNSATESLRFSAAVISSAYPDLAEPVVTQYDLPPLPTDPQAEAKAAAPTPRRRATPSTTTRTVRPSAKSGSATANARSGRSVAAKRSPRS